MNKKLIIVFILVALAGFIDATYLTVKHYQEASVACYFVNNCDQVLQSSYAVWGAVPVSLAGAIYYLILFSFSLISLLKRNKELFIIGAALTPVGFLTSLWFLYLQIFILNAFCLYCLASAFFSMLLFAGGLIFLVGLNDGENKDQAVLPPRAS